MNNGYERQAGLGRGRKLTTAGAARDCAQAVLDNYQRGGANMKYNMALFGKSMRVHLEDIRVNGGQIRHEIQVVVDKAETLLKVECDGQDCEFKKAG